MTHLAARGVELLHDVDVLPAEEGGNGAEHAGLVLVHDAQARRHTRVLGVGQVGVGEVHLSEPEQDR